MALARSGVLAGGHPGGQRADLVEEQGKVLLAAWRHGLVPARPPTHALAEVALELRPGTVREIQRHPVFPATRGIINGVMDVP
jgi:hypothetical protein